MEFFTSRPFEGIEIPDKHEFQRFLQVESEKIPGGVVLAFLEEIIHHRPFGSSKDIQKKLNTLDHNLIQDLHNYALRLLSKIYDNSDLKSWRELMKNPNFLEYCIVLGNTNYYKKMNAATNVNKLQMMAEVLDITLKYKSSESLSQITTFNEGKDMILYALEHKNKIFFLFPNRTDLGLWRTPKKKTEETKLIICAGCDNEYDSKVFQHKVCKCELCDLCISKHDGNKCGKCKKSVKKDLVKKFQAEIANSMCIGCKLRLPSDIEKNCMCKVCVECIHENPLNCVGCNSENYITNKTLEENLTKKSIINNFLKAKLDEVNGFEEKLIQDIQEFYRIIEKSKNNYLKSIEHIKKVITDNLKNLADVTLIKCLSLPIADLEYSISEAVILDLNISFDMKVFEEFFNSNFGVDFSIEVPVCYSCHSHLFKKPIKLTGCSCRICKECFVKNLSSLPECPHCNNITENMKEIEEYCGEKLQALCKSCYQEKSVSYIYKCGKGCTSCFDCLKKYLDPEPQCPSCNMPINIKGIVLT